MRGWTLLLSLAVLSFAEDSPPTFPKILSMIANPVFETTDIINTIDNSNLSISFDQSTLTNIIQSAETAHRQSSDTARIVIRLMQDCRYCRDQFWAPLGPDALQAALSKGSDFALEEVRVRGVKSVPAEVPFYTKLASDGASPELLAALEEKIVLPVPDGFKQLRLDKAPDFNAQSKEGKLTMHIELSAGSEAVFLFRHNALYYNVIKGDEPSILSATYTAFGPQKLEPTWNAVITPKLAKGKKLKKPVDTAKSVAPDSSSRGGLQVSVNNSDKDRHEYEIDMTWTRG